MEGCKVSPKVKKNVQYIYCVEIGKSGFESLKRETEVCYYGSQSQMIRENGWDSVV